MPVTAAILVPHPPLIIPAVGKGQQRRIQKTIDSYREAMAFLTQFPLDAAVIISPHAPVYADYFHISGGTGACGDFSRFGARETKAAAVYDEALAKDIAAFAGERGLPAGPLVRHGDDGLDHGSLVPLLFLGERAPKLPIVRMGVSGLPALTHYRLGQCIESAAGKKRVAVIASGDLSHRLKADGPYGLAPEGPALDRAILEALREGDFLKLLALPDPLLEKGCACGVGSLLIMAGALDARGVTSSVLSYEDTYGVGYAVATFLPDAADETRGFGDRYETERQQEALRMHADEDAYVRLARQAVTARVSSGKTIAPPEGLPGDLLRDRAGVFVSLHQYGQLRGCIGTIAPTTPCIAQEIIQNAISAATRDSRFHPVAEEELPTLTIKVDVLTPPEPIADIAQLDPARYGVIVKAGTRSGLLLPDLDGVDTAKRQVAIAMQKAGI
ncbi:MAG: AmmeMemoRadiSam system protein A, partial [Clostridiales bacterium]|nr:AmmeMemoRadiSam system protein A [Clostridiales bacterium]